MEHISLNAIYFWKLLQAGEMLYLKSQQSHLVFKLKMYSFVEE